MFSRPLVLGLIVAACVTAAAGGAFVAVHQNAAAVAADPVAAPETQPQPVSETEAVVTPPEAPAATPTPAEAPEPTAALPSAAAPATAKRVEKHEAVKPAPVSREQKTEPARPQSTRTASARPTDVPAAATPEPAPREVTVPAPAVPPAEAVSDSPRMPDPAPVRPEPQFVEVVVPSSAVIGLQVDRALSSETARVEDRVEARVTRDVMSDGRRAIPAGSKVLGSVVLVERGGKIKENARLGVRFHTLVLADRTQVPLRTEIIYRDGDPVTGESARKIGGAAVGGAILGAILGGGKGAMIGGATGAGAGTAAVMAGGRNPATLAAGTVVTARLDSPVTIQVEKE